MSEREAHGDRQGTHLLREYVVLEAKVWMYQLLGTKIVVVEKRTGQVASGNVAEHYLEIPKKILRGSGGSGGVGPGDYGLDSGAGTTRALDLDYGALYKKFRRDRQPKK